MLADAGSRCEYRLGCLHSRGHLTQVFTGIAERRMRKRYRIIFAARALGTSKVDLQQQQDLDFSLSFYSIFADFHITRTRRRWTSVHCRNSCQHFSERHAPLHIHSFASMKLNWRRALSSFRSSIPYFILHGLCATSILRAGVALQFWYTIPLASFIRNSSLTTFHLKRSLFGLMGLCSIVPGRLSWSAHI